MTRGRVARVAGLLAIVAIFFNAIAPFAHRAKPMSAIDGSSAVVLCTALGFESIAGDPSGVPEKAPAKVLVSYCPVCAAAQLAAVFLSPTEPGTYAPRRDGTASYFVADGFSAFHLQRLGFESRAPPPLV